MFTSRSPAIRLRVNSRCERGAVEVLVLLALVLLLAAACGDGEGGGESQVDVSGSSTVEPISTRVAELYEDTGAAAVVNVDGPGTGDGFQLFCDGQTDVSDASRPIEDEEVEACEANGVEFIELKIAFDGIAILTNPESDLDCLTFADLYALVGPEAEGFDTWADAGDLAAELGSTTRYPDGALQVVGPGEESGTYDSFVELVLGDLAEERVAAGAITEAEAETTRPDYQSSSDDNTIIQGVEGGTTAIGWVGYAFAQEAGEGVRQVGVDGGDGCVEPSATTIADGSYPISRPLFLYVSTASLDENPAVAGYVEFYLGDGLRAVEEVGYVPLPADQLIASRRAFADRLTGAQTSPE